VVTKLLRRQAVHPRRSKNDRGGVELREGALAGELRSPVFTEGRGGIGFEIRRPFLAVENEVGRKMDQGRAPPLDLCAERPDQSGVDGVGHVRLLLRAVDVGVSAGVDDHVRFRFLDKWPYRFGAETLVGSRRRHHLGERGEGAGKLVTDLTPSAE
jgi:hypothetical protein